MQRSCRLQRIHENDFVETGNRAQSGSELVSIVSVQRAVADTVLQNQPPFFILVPHSVDFAEFLADTEAQVTDEFGDDKAADVGPTSHRGEVACRAYDWPDETSTGGLGPAGFLKADRPA